MYSPLELEQIEFEKKAFGGYSMEDVDRTFSVLKRDYEELYVENSELKKKLKALESQVSESEDMKETLHNVLIAAQKSSDEKKEASEKEAELIIKKAELDAEKIKRGAEKEVMDLEKKKEDLKNEVSVFVTKMSALFEAQVKYLNKSEEL